MSQLTPHLTITRPIGRLAAALLAAIALALTGLAAGGAPPAKAATALGCSFTASQPYLSAGYIKTTLAVRCSQDTALYWHARLTKDDWFFDTSVGSSNGYHVFPAGQTIRWVLHNNLRTCPGGGDFFGKLSIQARPLSTAYVHRSVNSRLSHC